VTASVWYVCTNFNNSQHSINACESFIGVFGSNGRIIVVDNASDADDVQELSAYAAAQNSVQILHLESNIGYFPGLNRGLDHLAASGDAPDWVFIGNNDILFSDGNRRVLAEMSDVLRKYSVIAPDIVTADGVHQNPHVVNQVSPMRRRVYDVYYRSYIVAQLIVRASGWLGKFVKRKDSMGWAESREIWSGHGACYLLSSKFLEEHKRFHAPSFLYFEEAFLAMQLEAASEKIWYEAALKIEHLCNGAMKNVPSRRVWEYASDSYFKYLEVVRSEFGKDGRRL
jgi:GT2 family glycosyltransferase